jgi:Orsellinic acid/F9775 biosynthesis cluster protein D
LKITIEKIMEYLDIEGPPMNVQEVDNWMEETWIVERSISGIPVQQGFSCNLCNYCSGNKNSMKNHFSKSHKGSKWSDSTKECKVQRPFNGKFHKFIQLEDGNDLELESDQEEDWQTILKEDFKRKIEKQGSSKESDHMDLRLMGAFIAKVRWDLAIKDVDGKRLSELVGLPTIRDNLHKVLLCGRRYIKQCCEKLNGGNMMVRRKLICARYKSNSLQNSNL